MICCMYCFPLGGSARKSRVLPAMITKLVEKDLLYVFCYMRGFCQKDKGSASHDSQVSRKDLLYVLCYMRGFCQKDKGSAEADPKNYRGGSARFTMVLLAMIPKLVQRVLLHVFHLSRGFCQKDKGSASHDS